MVNNPIFHVTAPPPTPNGDLHVGHLSGPYFGADVFSRFHLLKGFKVISALSIDENQSYVVTTAERLQKDPREIATKNYNDIRNTLQMANIHFDVVGRPDENYTKFVLQFFNTLHSAGVFVEKEVQVFYSKRDQRYLFESYINGRCPTCFSLTKGNICESCGNPNDPLTLIHAMQLGSHIEETNDLEIRTIRALFLPIEPYRSRIEKFFEESVEKTRPTLRVLIKTLLQSELQDFPINYISDWGISVPFDGLESSVYNVWAEMYPGHLYWLREVGLNMSEENLENIKYIQFLGFDNSYFYAIVHLAIAMAAQDAGLSISLPSHFITNEFYLLDNYKFSTSKGHLIWGKDLLSEYNVDAVRFYLSYSNPETQQTNFSLDNMIDIIQTQLVEKFEKIRIGYNHLIEQGLITNGSSQIWNSWIQTFQKRFELAYDPDTFSLRSAANTLINYMEFLADEIEKAFNGKEPKSGLGSAIAALALFATPLMPNFASSLGEKLGINKPLTWTEIPSIQKVLLLPPDLISLKSLV